MSDEDTTKKLSEIEERRAARRRANEGAKQAQHAIDLERLDALEEQHGWDAVEPLHLSRYEPGCATMLIALLPRMADAKYKRFMQRANGDKSKASHKLEAGEELARSCLIYPSPTDDAELYNSTVDFAPGILGHLAKTIVEAVQGKEEDEGK